MFFVCNKFARIHVVIMGYCLYNFEENNEFNPCCEYFPDALQDLFKAVICTTAN